MRRLVEEMMDRRMTICLDVHRGLLMLRYMIWLEILKSLCNEEKRKNRPPITNKREATHGQVVGPPGGEMIP